MAAMTRVQFLDWAAHLVQQGSQACRDSQAGQARMENVHLMNENGRWTMLALVGTHSDSPQIRDRVWDVVAQFEAVAVIVTAEWRLRRLTDVFGNRLLRPSFVDVFVGLASWPAQGVSRPWVYELVREDGEVQLEEVPSYGERLESQLYWLTGVLPQG
ncbi:hypothetical protein ABZ543_13230 [Streptomyces roseifaciens]